jgi:hypothetical protein
MKRLNVALVILASALLVITAAPCRAQYMGTFSQQTVTQTFTGDYTSGGTATEHFSIQNLGQAGHQVTYKWSNLPDTGSVMLEGSIDGTNWIIMASGGETPSVQSFIANGYFPFVRISVNAEQNTISTGASVSVQYTGYQNPIQPQSLFEGFTPVSAGAYAQIQPTSGVQSFLNPAILGGFSCSNPNASIAYVDIVSTAVTPVLGTATPMLEVPIAASSSVLYAGPPLVGAAPFYFGAATASHGSTPVTTAVYCTGTINPYGPFAPILFATAN